MTKDLSSHVHAQCGTSNQQFTDTMKRVLMIPFHHSSRNDSLDNNTLACTARLLISQPSNRLLLVGKLGSCECASAVPELGAEANTQRMLRNSC